MEKQHDRFLYLGTKYRHVEVNPMVYFITSNLIIALLFNLPTACYPIVIFIRLAFLLL